jgi:hypothetical protein
LAGVPLLNNTQFVAVDPNQPLRLAFTERMNFIDAEALKIILTHDHTGQTVGSTLPFHVAWEEGSDVSYALLTPTSSAHWPVGARFEIRINGFYARDMGGNKLGKNIQMIVRTTMDPSVRTVVNSEDLNAWVDFLPEVLGPLQAGTAISDNPGVESVSAVSGLTQLVRNAVENMTRPRGGVTQRILHVKEFQLYALGGEAVSPSLGGRVTLTFRYNDSNGDGVVDETEGHAPVKINDLAIHWLDEKTGAWVKQPASTSTGSTR